MTPVNSMFDTMNTSYMTSIVRDIHCMPLAGTPALTSRAVILCSMLNLCSVHVSMRNEMAGVYGFSAELYILCTPKDMHASTGLMGLGDPNLCKPIEGGVVSTRDSSSRVNLQRSQHFFKACMSHLGVGTHLGIHDQSCKVYRVGFVGVMFVCVCVCVCVWLDSLYTTLHPEYFAYLTMK